MKDSQEEKVGVTKDKKKGLGCPPLRGKFNEEEFARSFGETLIQWRGEERDGEQIMTMDGTQKPARTGKLQRPSVRYPHISLLSTLTLTSFMINMSGVSEETNRSRSISKMFCA